MDKHAHTHTHTWTGSVQNPVSEWVMHPCPRHGERHVMARPSVEEEVGEEERGEAVGFTWALFLTS